MPLPAQAAGSAGGEVPYRMRVAQSTSAPPFGSSPPISHRTLRTHPFPQWGRSWAGTLSCSHPVRGERGGEVPYRMRVAQSTSAPPFGGSPPVWHRTLRAHPFPRCVEVLSVKITQSPHSPIPGTKINKMHQWVSKNAQWVSVQPWCDI